MEGGLNTRVFRRWFVAVATWKALATEVVIAREHGVEQRALRQPND